MLEKTALFKRRALKVIPNLKKLRLEDDHWLQASVAVEKLGVKRLTSTTLLLVFSEITKTDIDKLHAELARKPLSRSAKPIFDSHQQHQRPLKRRRKDSGENSFLFAGNTQLHSPIRKTGVRIIPEPAPATPERGYPQVYLTPNKTNKIRPFLSKRLGTFFKPVTPDGPKPRGKIDISMADRTKLRSKFKSYLFDRPSPIEFTITLEKIEDRQGKKRIISQKKLTGISCIEVFKADGCSNEEYITVNGHDYHWSHMVAYFLGGDHHKENLIPATAAANYNILEVVENFIAEKMLNQVKEDRISEIAVTVTPYYSTESQSDIPDLLIFELNWQSPNGLNFAEKIEINPRSYQRVTGTMHRSIAVFRKIEELEVQKRMEEIEEGQQEISSMSLC
ncbi:DNA/RNA non-specific endonuclease [Legionella micdadei]|uniref:DNA/RNA non-specific endonuclease n=1 Tax=Legionella micdadei TaxID=451 RepID=A0A098GBH5_LEGMI|nr:DNA/RNA non-specific endonuclease [Legionella micdadei]ARG98476.1 hypothetical protein B6N58_12855 [Legionella micdadei]ARH01221.1 hypothetical protein B6V88_12865 [Legionella micdadei]KTD30312.1 hypothetical protein Lmic_0063 [Legionella micdadei]NSL18413.1 DNA/RNA non-specific endonuclease [Legionella micdadei]CEG59834.1 protein of unknown function [Legionella micdadei]